MKQARHATKRKQRKTRLSDLKFNFSHIKKYFHKQTSKSIQTRTNKKILGWLLLTRLQIIIVCTLTCSLVLALSQSISIQNDKTQKNTVNNITLIEVNSQAASRQNDNNEPIDPDSSTRSTEIDSLYPEPSSSILPPTQPNKIITKEIKQGDTLSELFIDAGLSPQDVYKITNSSKEGKSLTRMYPGEKLFFEFNVKNELISIKRQHSLLKTTIFKPSVTGFSVETIEKDTTVRQVQRTGIINQSLWLAADKSNIPHSLVMSMAGIFSGVIDFALDVRKGDKFSIIYEEHYLDEKKIKDGNIIAAQFINAKKSFNAFRYLQNNGEVDYFNENGESMRKAFLRAPLDFTRVSSNFNMRRLHPITKKVRPHRGIDYAAPTGTPIYTVGDGIVQSSGYSKSNGNFIIIRHGEIYTTKYLHLQKKHVKKGQRVNQGQIIGKVGCTGLCTGPHLHYEFLLNGVHRNPRTIINKLPKAKSLAKNELPEFKAATSQIKDTLNLISKSFDVALTE